MPHSPGVYRGELYVHNSGTGYFGKIDRKKGVFEPITFCPGYLRGMAFLETMRSSVFLDHAKIKPLAAFNWMQNSFNGMQKLGADCKL